MLLEPYWENLIIYGENVSIFYLVCALISFLAVWFTWNIEPKTSDVSSKESLVQSSSGALGEISEEALRLKAERKELLQLIKDGLSVDDRARESETEKQQLLDILELMKNDEKFNSMTMEELQEQLKLYRE